MNRLCPVLLLLLASPAVTQGLPPVYVDTLLRVVSTQQAGYRPYVARRATMDGRVYPRSLVTEVNNNVSPNDRRSTLNLRLDGRFARFQAVVGRDDTEHANGPAYCYFEVYGDGRRLFRSEAIRSALTAVRAGPSASKRKVPQEVDVSVRGVLQLQLVTRFASEFTQQAPLVNRASGCVWGNARLLPPAPPGAPSDRQLVPDDALRAAVRTAALRVSSRVSGSPDYERRLPLALGIAPLRVEAGAPGDEAGVRALLAQQMFALKRGLADLFKALPPADSAALAAALPASGSARNSPASVAAIGGGVKADLVLFGALARAASGWQVQLRLVETRTGRAVAVETVDLASSGAGAGD